VASLDEGATLSSRRQTKGAAGNDTGAVLEVARGAADSVRRRTGGLLRLLCRRMDFRGHGGFSQPRLPRSSSHLRAAGLDDLHGGNQLELDGCRRGRSHRRERSSCGVQIWATVVLQTPAMATSSSIVKILAGVSEAPPFSFPYPLSGSGDQL
jgi:hypothetical protein